MGDSENEDKFPKCKLLHIMSSGDLSLERVKKYSPDEGVRGSITKFGIFDYVRGSMIYFTPSRRPAMVFNCMFEVPS